MKLIILNRGGRPARCLNVGAAQAGVAGLAVALLLGLAGATGFALSGLDDTADTPELAALRAELDAQRTSLKEIRRAADEELDALALRMGQLNAQVIRLNALGGRLTSMAGLEDGEFDFQSLPAVGGPAEMLDDARLTGQLPSLLDDFDMLDATLEGQRQQLAALEGLLLNRKLHNRVYPSGRPVKTGWISSFFGKRSDPITGKTAWHKGIDFAGKYGNDVVAVGDGVVSYSGTRKGYGNLVEIKHGNGYVTRYAHNQENLVAVGDKVAQGQTIALMGSSGRSTGPHVHFEVHRNGQQVDPAKYIQRR